MFNQRYLIGFFAWYCSSVFANTLYQQSAEITESVKRYVEENTNDERGARIEIDVQQPDRRLLLPQCDQKLQSSALNDDLSGDQVNVSVRCNGNIQWSLYVPVTIKRFAKVVVATKAIKRGDTLYANDLTLMEQRLDGSSKLFFFDTKDAIGYVANRSIYANAPVSLNAVKRPMLVKRGEHVVIFATTGGLTVKMSGTALMDGAKGQIVKVKNQSSNRTIEARVVDQSMVEVRL